MNTRPTNNSYESVESGQNQEPPLHALAVGILPAGLASNWSINALHGSGDELADIGYGPGRALAIGPSGPPIRPLSEAEAAAAEVPKHGEVTIEWGGDGIKTDHATDYAAIVQKVLADNGVKTVNSLGDDKGKPVVKAFTMDQIAAFLVDSGTPAMLNVGDENGQRQHAVTVQWDPNAAPGEGRFLVNNLDAHGSSQSFTKEQFVAGTFRVNTSHTGTRGAFYPSIQRKSVIIFAKKP